MRNRAPTVEDRARTTPDVQDPPSDDFAETPAERDEPVISLPSPPQVVPPAPFPWLMMLTPAALGIGLVVMTGSTFALVFAALGPVLALGTLIDQSLQRRARHRRDDDRFTDALLAAELEVEARLGRERARRLSRHAPISRLLEGRPTLVARDERAPDVGFPIGVGLTAIASGIRLDAPGGEDDRRVRDLIDRGRALDGIPLAVRVRRLAVVGPASVAVEVALGIVVDVAMRCPDGFGLTIRGTTARRPVVAELVGAGLLREGAIRLSEHHRGSTAGHGTPVNVGDARKPAGSRSGVEVDLALVDDVAAAPTDVDLVLELDDRNSAIVIADGGATRVTPQAVTAGEFRRWARRFIDDRRRRGFGRAVFDDIPSELSLEGLLRSRPPAAVLADDGGLAVPIGAAAEGAVWLDLVRDGPHAVVGGTTGSGKSELLRAWIVGLAARYPATHVAVLCIDFKGGATFDAIADLPHCVGLVTDLDGDEATRVLAGLRAELRYREHELRRHGVRDIATLSPGTLNRLVVVVDEFQALVDEHRELHDAFADLAARGRSLGIHLILCAQRPAGAARESLLANCTIRVSLRVTNAADSHAVIGSGDAADLPTDRRGRALVALGDAPREIQVARSCDDLLSSTRARRTSEIDRSGRPRPRAPWLPPLPPVLAGADADLRLGTASAGRVPVALLDDPHHQRQHAFELEVRGGTHLLVVGPPGSGKSTALASIAGAAQRAGCAVERIRADAELAWDAIEGIRRRGARDPVVVVVDDLDQCAASFGDEHRHSWLGSVADLAKLGSSRGITFVWSASRATGEIGQFVGLARDALRLGSPSRHEFVLSGGETADYRANLPPGRGVTRGLLAQVPLPPSGDPDAQRAQDSRTRIPVIDVARMASEGAALVTRRPLERAAQLASAGIALTPVPRPGAALDNGATLTGSTRSGPTGGVVTIGEPDAWQQSYGALGRAAVRAPVIFDDVPTAAIRSLLPGEPVSPPVADPARVVLVREIGGEVRRFAWQPPGERPDLSEQ